MRRKQPSILREPIAWLSAAVLALIVVGCSEPYRPEAPGATVPEASLADQAEAVRRGEAKLIRLDRTQVSDADLKNLDGLEDKLERINLSRTELTDAGLEKLCGMTHLVQLRLRSPHITDAGMTHLQQLRKLRHLHLIDVPLTDAGLEPLHALMGLDSLYLDHTHATDAGLKQLEQALPNVHFHIDGGHQRLDSSGAEHTHEH